MPPLLLDLSAPPLATCASTQDHCCRLAREEAPEGTVVRAREQTAGRGRRERPWASPLDRGLWMSFVLRPRLDTARWPALTALTALAAAGALEALPGRPEGWQASIKWPNDLYGRGGKLGGILAETLGGAVVIGLGINLEQRPEEFPAGLAAPATSLFLEGFRPVPGPEEVAQAFNEHLTAAYARFQNGSGEFLQEGLRRRFHLRGARVGLHAGRETVEGTAVDVGPGGELILQTREGRQTCLSGEIEWIEPGAPEGNPGSGPS